jgi:hypothetical protein
MSASDDQLDLHGHTAAEAIERFVEQYNLRVKSGQCECWTIVHGYGSTGEGGVIRNKLRAFLAQHPDKLRHEPGDKYGNPGWTWVYPKIRLPDRRERTALEILSFCSTPRSEEKIVAEFPNLAGMQVKEALQSLVKQGKLQVLRTGLKRRYQAATQ